MIRLPPASPGSHRAILAAAGLAVLTLGALAVLHPELRFVDFIPFAARTYRLLHGPVDDPLVPVLDGGDLVNGLYPVGYPLLLVLGQALLGDVLVAGKVLAVLAGVGAIAGAARVCGLGAAAWMLAQGVVLLHGSMEGTDLPAAALALAALAALHDRRSTLAGALAGAAVMMRYTGVAVVPVVLLAAPSRPRAFFALLVATAPHWLVAAWTGASVWPDQSQNLTIAAGHPTTLLSLETLARWPFGVWRALTAGLGTWPVALGGLGLLLGAIRRDRRALLLLAYALVHAALLGVAFSNPRLALPVTACAALGAGWLLPPRRLALGAGLLLLWNLRTAVAPDPVAERAAAVSVAVSTVEGPCLSTSPWVYQRRDGWLIPSIDLTGLRVAPLTPGTLRSLARQHGAACVALDVTRTRGAWPGLHDLLGSGPVPGYRRLEDPAGWRIWAVEADPADVSSPVTPAPGAPARAAPPLEAPGVPR